MLNCDMRTRFDINTYINFKRLKWESNPQPPKTKRHNYYATDTVKFTSISAWMVYHGPGVGAAVDVVQHVSQLRHSGSQAGQLGELPPGQHEAADSFRHFH